jgi:hypothetical protein
VGFFLCYGFDEVFCHLCFDFGNLCFELLMADQRKPDLGVIFIDLFWKFLALFF